MKIPLAAFLLLLATFAAAQTQYVSKTGKVHFFSSTPLEDIEAITNTAVLAINPTNGKVYAKILQTSFQFKQKLMQEHFNENYMESDKYPNAVLDMVMKEAVDYTKDGEIDVTLKGTLEMHGVKKEREIKGKLTIKGGVPVNASATFDVALADHKIKVPTAVVAKIAEVIKVDANFDLTKYEMK